MPIFLYRERGLWLWFYKLIMIPTLVSTSTLTRVWQKRIPSYTFSCIKTYYSYMPTVWIANFSFQIETYHKTLWLWNPNDLLLLSETCRLDQLLWIQFWNQIQGRFGLGLVSKPYKVSRVSFGLYPFHNLHLKLDIINVFFSFPAFLFVLFFKSINIQFAKPTSLSPTLLLYYYIIYEYNFFFQYPFQYVVCASSSWC